MLPNKVVAHYQDGRILKGSTSDFVPAKDHFHLTGADAPVGTKPTYVSVAELKAVFFVKDLAGKPGHLDRKEFDPARPVMGRKLQVSFKDGEVLVGTTQGYQPGRSGFFVTPADPESNIDRCFVVSGATKDVHFL
ncbi:MAG TPA: hypothetical protein VN083_00840 [Vicinamibacteria bacterium]|jgi:hypothetical protein|nr:hypothetical protein [Vicinamibacteria bacterium]